VFFDPDPDWEGVTATRPELRPRIPRQPAPVPTGLPGEVESRLAELAGVAAPPPLAQAEPEVPGVAAPNVAALLLHVAEVMTLGCFALLIAWAVLSARLGDGSAHFHQLPFAAWGLGATVCALTSAKLAGDTYAGLHARRRVVLVAALVVALLVCVTGVVVNTDGASGPAWVLFLPVVLATGAVGGRATGLAVGAGAAAGLYVATGMSHALDPAGVGRLVVLLPAFPSIGWSAGALASLARESARDAELQRRALEQDVERLSEVLACVADGDLTVMPAASPTADPATTAVAVTFADTLVALRRLVHQLDSVAGQLSGSAEDLAGRAEAEAGAINAQVAAVAQTTQTIEQLASTAAAIAETAVQVAQLAGATRGDVDAGTAAVEEVSASMARIEHRMADVDHVVDELSRRIQGVAVSARVIDELSRRTSMLAVNAAVEAARVNAHGQGFRHVAAEIADLATRARDATARIHGIVTELDAEVAATADAGREADAALVQGSVLQADVVEALARISTMVDYTTVATREITEATRQQRVASDAVVEAMSTVLHAGQQYREGGRKHAEAAARMRDLATDVRRTLDRFTIDRGAGQG
jgi:methyl-accepting chemotaxis protein